MIKQYDITCSQKDKYAIIQKIDSVEASMVHCALAWTPKGIRVAYWDKFGVPEWVFSKTSQIGSHDLAIMSGWWYDKEKALAIEEAKKSNKVFEGNGKIREVYYWKNLKK